MSSGPSLLSRLYVANATLLVTHEIDAAFWHEWKLFHIPGGIQVFLLLHLATLPLVFLGYRHAVSSKRGARVASFLMGVVGLAAFGIHAVFLSVGSQEFRLPVSLAVLLGIGLVSIAQLTIVLMSPSQFVLRD